MKVTIYGSRWFRAKNRMTEVWDEEKAKLAHLEKRPYAVLIEGGTVFRCFLEIGSDYVGIGFLDEHMREFLSYQFQEIEAGRLFLTMATHREYVGDCDQLKEGTTYYFRKDGGLTMETEDFSTSVISSRETRTNVDGNWEAYPEFGSYESISRVDRGVAFSHGKRKRD
ncbi:MAG: lytic transglycosylase [Planctomyces sp.]|nr:lytic transglycosylase [Planctomyces sp.]